MKKIIALLMSLTLLLGVLSGCGSPTSSTTPDGDNANNTTNVPETDVIHISCAHGVAPGSPTDEGVQKWCDLLYEMSGGTMVMEDFPSSQLGSTPEIMDQAVAGDAVITLADGAYYFDRGAKDMGILFAPYLFDNWDQCWTLIESDWYQDQCDLLANDCQLKILTSNWIYGERHTLTTKPVNAVEDLKGMKIRVPNNTIQIKGFEVLGATPTPMNLGDVYTALQQGTIDGLENPLSVLENNKYQEVAKYLLLDGHVMNFTTWFCGTSFFDSLTEEQQQWLIESGNQAGIYNNELQENADAEYLQKLIDAGVTVKELTTEEKEKFREAAKAFYEQPEFTSVWSEGLYDTVNAIIRPGK